MKGDLVVLVADEDMRAVIETLLGEKYCHQLRIRKIKFRVIKHPNRDPGVRNDAHEVLRIHQNDYSRALVILDYEGSGFDDTMGNPEKLEKEIREKIVRNTRWNTDDVEVIVIKPELEIWVWGVADKFPEVFGLEDIIQNPDSKPLRPKEEFEKILKRVGRPPSSALFREIAKKVNRNHVDNCRDRAFKKLVDTLRGWFGVSSS